MKNIKDILGKIDPGGEVGLEIEVELEDGEDLYANQLPSLNTDVWKIVEDGSLRGGGELVLLKPLSIEVLSQELYSLQKVLSGEGVRYSSRTSVHVHINILDLTPRELLRFIVLACLFEIPMSKYCGKSREGNLFCLGSRHAEGFWDGVALLKRFLTESSVNRVNMSTFEQDFRYSFVNICSVVTLGSLEFRGMRGTHSPRELLAWVKFLLSLKKKAIEMKGLYFFNRVRKEGLWKFSKEILPSEMRYKGVFNDIQKMYIDTKFFMLSTVDYKV